MKNKSLQNFFRQPFEFDCNMGKKVPFSLIHKPRPLNLSKELTLSIEYLLWYVPNINSIQSEKNPLIEKKLYENFTFQLLMEEMGMSKEDTLFLDKIEDSIVDYYKDEICCHCQKIILTQADGETKSSSLLRHTRNSIAHGLFNIVDDMFIGFDLRELDPQKNGYNCTGIVKIRPKSLIKALALLDEELTHEKLAEKAFVRCGYKIIENDRDKPSLPFDFSMEKNGKKFAVEVKKFNVEGLITPPQVEELEHHFTQKTPITNVLLVDSGKLSKEAKIHLQNKSIVILDQSNIEDLLLGLDVLSNIEKK